MRLKHVALPAFVVMTDGSKHPIELKLEIIGARVDGAGNVDADVGSVYGDEIGSFETCIPALGATLAGGADDGTR